MKILRDQPMAERTTFKIGGVAEVIYQPETRKDLSDLVDRLNGEMDRAFFLGRGSNLLVPDGTVKTPFIKLAGEFTDLEFDDESVRAGGAVLMPELALASARSGCAGLEWASGVPGTVGGAVMMNAGAYENETADWLIDLTVMERDGSIKQIPAEEVDFDYRHCGIKDEALIVNATWRLIPDKRDAVLSRTRRLIKERREQQPVGYNSAGCIFKNGEDYSAAYLIDEAGLKGLEEGPVIVSEKHANYFINRGGAGCADVLRLIDRVRRRIMQLYDIELELELCIIDE